MNALAPTRHTGVLQPSTFAELMQFAKTAAASDLMPKDYKGKPENIMIAVQMGSEIGLSPMQAIQNIAVINGRPSVWGDALLALVRSDPRCVDVKEWIEGEGDARTAHCVIKRKGASDVAGRFSVADAKRAGLWGKQGPWQQYPDRMQQLRARGFSCRDAFPDRLKGLISAEEARDIPAEPFSGTTIDAAPDPAPDRASQLARAERIMEGQPLETAAAIGDDMPNALSGRDELLVRADQAIAYYEKCSTQEAYSKASPKTLLSDLDRADRPTLKERLVAAMMRAKDRIAEADMGNAAEPEVELPE